jgi:hypothetical protein
VPSRAACDHAPHVDHHAYPHRRGVRLVDRIFIVLGLLMFLGFVALVLVFPHTPWAR